VARSSGPRLPAGRNVATPKAIELPEGAAGYGTGTVVHADVLRNGKDALVNLDVAFSGAAFSQEFAPAAYENEVGRLVANLDKKAALGRGTGLELGLLSDPKPLIGKLSLAEAPASTDLIRSVVGPIGISGIVQAELLRSAAMARATANGCPLSNEAGYGLGSVLNLEVLGGLLAMTSAQPPYREVSQSSSATRIIRRADDNVLGLKSETRQTIAPVTFFNKTPFQFTVEVLGEWALRAMAFGNEGGSSVHYGPRNVSPQTPVVRILDRKGDPIIQVTTQMLLGKKGLEIVIPEVAEIVIGEDPRMIGDNAASDPLIEATQVAAAADVVRVRLLKEGQLADVRVGHMEAAVKVPSGGVKCPGLTVDQTVNPPTVTTGDEFTYTITITNPNDCIVTGLKVVETTTLPAGVTIEVVSTTPTGGSQASGVVTYPDIGPLEPNQTKTIKIKSKVPLGSAEGLIKALAVAEGVCPVEVQPPGDTDGPQTEGTPDTGDEIPVRGEDAVDGPNVDTCIVPDIEGDSLADAIKAITDAGCDVGKVTEDPDADPDDEGKITEQGPDEPGTSVPKGTDVDITVGGDLCTVPSVIGETTQKADDILEAAGCDLGDTKPGTDNTGTPGTISTQDPPAGDVVLAGTDVDVVLIPGGDTNLVAASTNCNVPGLVGMTEAEARTKVEAAGCILVTEPKNTSNPNELGKVMTQNPGADAVVPRGSTVKVGIGVQVLGDTLTAGQEAAAPDLARTGGLLLGGLSLWLLVAGLAVRAAGSDRLWRLARRRKG
jgi:uncharacterized repeat protein (TIGR01451 family)